MVAKFNHKYGTKIPKNISEALSLDLKNGNTQWREPIDLEMNTILLVPDILPYDEKVPLGMQNHQNT